MTVTGPGVRIPLSPQAKNKKGLSNQTFFILYKFLNYQGFRDQEQKGIKSKNCGIDNLSKLRLKSKSCGEILK
ncbi:hypothetical protein [Flavobacterium columnare]|uniref:hypothetical protein n=1 Tax=Flavobacterium columnare TaxID=996 RepID=UPI0040332A18